MDELIASGNEKLKALYNDVEKYKKKVLEDMSQLGDGNIDVCDKYIETINKTHNLIKKQVEELIGGLSHAQRDAKEVSERLSRLEDEQSTRHNKLSDELKVKVDDELTISRLSNLMRLLCRA
mgnify:CR=1 FL=1